MLAAMRRLLGGRPASRDGETTHLYWASAQGELDLVRLLLDEGADANERSPDGEGTPLCAAACHGDTEIVRELLDHGADPDLKEDDWFTPLRWAASNGHLETALVLLDRGADPDLGSPLAAAARRGSLGVFRALLDRGADPAAADYDGHTPLAIAVEWADKDVEAELVTRVGLLARARGDGLKGAEIVRSREPAGDGTVVVSVEARFPDESSLGADLQTGHAEIAAILRARSPAATDS
jgi:ankyrin repeat protein